MAVAALAELVIPKNPRVAIAIMLSFFMKTSLSFSFLIVSLNLNRPKFELSPSLFKRSGKVPNKKVNLKLFFLIKNVDFISFFNFFWG